MSSAQRILCQVADGVATITINRPEKKNAFTLAMYEELVATFDRAEKDREVRVLLITGAGDAFTAGNDLGDFMQNPPSSEDTPVFRLLLQLVDLNKPLMAAVNGAAVGIGTTMLLHADVVYASEKARFHMPFINLGLVPEGGSSYLLPRLVGQQKASELLLFGEPFDALQARDLGLVSQVVESPRLESFALERAKLLAEKPRSGVLRTKRLLKESRRDAVLQAIRAEAALFMRSLSSPEAMEAFQAFFEKRKPDFSKIEPSE